MMLQSQSVARIRWLFGPSLSPPVAQHARSNNTPLLGRRFASGGVARPSGLGTSGSGSASPGPQRRSVKPEHGESKEKLIVEQLAKDGLIPKPVVTPSPVDARGESANAEASTSSASATVGSGSLFGGPASTTTSAAVAAPSTGWIADVPSSNQPSLLSKPPSASGLLSRISSAPATEASVDLPKREGATFGQFGNAALASGSGPKHPTPPVATASNEKAAPSMFSFGATAGSSSASPSALSNSLGSQVAGAGRASNPFSAFSSSASTVTSSTPAKVALPQLAFGSGSETSAATPTSDVRPTAGLRRSALVAPAPILVSASGSTPSVGASFNFSGAAASPISGTGSIAVPAAAESKPAQGSITFGPPGASGAKPAAATFAFGQIGAAGSAQPSSGTVQPQAPSGVQPFSLGNGQHAVAPDGGMGGAGQASGATSQAKPFSFSFAVGKS